jgi:hypothetical protein
MTSLVHVFSNNGYTFIYQINSWESKFQNLNHTKSPAGATPNKGSSATLRKTFILNPQVWSFAGGGVRGTVPVTLLKEAA